MSTINELSLFAETLLSKLERFKSQTRLESEEERKVEKVIPEVDSYFSHEVWNSKQTEGNDSRCIHFEILLKENKDMKLRAEKMICMQRPAEHQEFSTQGEQGRGRAGKDVSRELKTYHNLNNDFNRYVELTEKLKEICEGKLTSNVHLCSEYQKCVRKMEDLQTSAAGFAMNSSDLKNKEEALRISLSESNRSTEELKKKLCKAAGRCSMYETQLLKLNELHNQQNSDLIKEKGLTNQVSKALSESQELMHSSQASLQCVVLSQQEIIIRLDFRAMYLNKFAMYLYLTK
jgi:hypothetical protein